MFQQRPRESYVMVDLLLLLMHEHNANTGTGQSRHKNATAAGLVLVCFGRPTPAGWILPLMFVLKIRSVTNPFLIPEG